MDMVCVAAEGVTYDPLNDPIRVLNNGKTLTAQGTSLGADDGIGVALCLYFLENTTLRHGPLRVIFTVNEEDGLASGDMDAKYLDAAYLINLDWEWLGSLCNSSAGGDFLTFTREARWEAAAPDAAALQISLKRLLGGHSGVDINRGRANALVCIAQALHELTRQGVRYGIADFRGGQARNAIPSSAEAILLVPSAQADTALAALRGYEAQFQAGFGNVESGYQFAVDAADSKPAKALTEDVSGALVRLLLMLPNNVHTMSPFVAGLTESSQNLGVLAMDEQTVTLSAMERSCEAYRAGELMLISQCVAESCGFLCRCSDHVPSWAVNPKSKLTPLACAVYEQLTGRNMVVEPVHGGLECGAFFEKNPELDMIAIGPSLQDVHSPKESCDLESVQVTAELIAAILERLT